MLCALRRNLPRRTGFAIDETHSKDEGEARWCEENSSESGDIHPACDSEDEAATQAERLSETQDARSNSGNSGNARFG